MITHISEVGNPSTSATSIGSLRFSHKTRECALCGKLECPDAEIILQDFWMCPTCLSQLRVHLNIYSLKR